MGAEEPHSSERKPPQQKNCSSQGRVSPAELRTRSLSPTGPGHGSRGGEVQSEAPMILRLSDIQVLLGDAEDLRMERGPAGWI